MQINETITRMRNESVPDADFLWLQITKHWLGLMNPNDTRRFLRHAINTAQVSNLSRLSGRCVTVVPWRFVGQSPVFTHPLDRS